MLKHCPLQQYGTNNEKFGLKVDYFLQKDIIL